MLSNILINILYYGAKYELRLYEGVRFVGVPTVVYADDGEIGPLIWAAVGFIKDSGPNPCISCIGFLDFRSVF